VVLERGRTTLVGGEWCKRNSIAMAGSGEVNAVVLPRGQPRAEGPACVLGIGTAVPPAEFLQTEYPDFFFNITNCSDKEALKAKFKRICKSPSANPISQFLPQHALATLPMSRCYPIN